jgi:hypothetical protein
MNSIKSAAENPRLMAWRIALGISLFAWFVKSKDQINLFFQGPDHAIRHHTLLPDWLCSPVVGGVAYFMPVLCFLALRAHRAVWLRLAGLTHAACSLVMLWHVQSYNDATHLTAFYVGLWLAWWAGRVERTDAASYWHGIALAIGIISLCWLGGGIGKLTPEYWAGEPFYHLYFMDKAQFPFSWMRAHLSQETIHLYAQWFSRTVVVAELVLATCILWSPRWAITASILALSGMVVISQLQLFSVLGSLMGLALAVGWLLKSEPNSTTTPS